MQQQLYKGRDRRKKGWFWMDNDYLNGFAKYFGPTGTAIYVSLCRHADNETQQCFPAIDLIAEENGITSKNTVIKYLKLFEQYRIISIERDKDPVTKKQLNNVYTLLDKEEWIKPDEMAWRKPRVQPMHSDSPESRVHSVTKPGALVDQSRVHSVRHKDTQSEGDSFKETHSLPTVKGKTPNGDVTELIALLQGTFALKVLDGTQQENRRYCWLALQKFGHEGVESIMQVARQDTFWRTKITGFKTLYYHGVKIASTQRIANVTKIS